MRTATWITPVLFVSLLGCSGEITAEELCGRADEAGCFEGSGDSYDSCVAVNKPSEEEARRLGCVSEHQTLRACILGELDVGVCALYGISDMCGAEIWAVRQCLGYD
ncbi:MAG: hypothetical protein RLO52_42450 [Sandaracinaceae bacterium]|nr:MAG: hypothetical protein EVA89_33845 [Sandaracinaceae bacterium]